MQGMVNTYTVYASSSGTLYGQIEDILRSLKHFPYHTCIVSVQTFNTFIVSKTLEQVLQNEIHEKDTLEGSDLA